MSQPLILESAAGRYRWHDHWATLPDTPAHRNNGRTHGIAALDDGRIVVFAQGVPGVLFFDARGRLVDAWGDRFVGAHGLSITRHHGPEQLWLTDQESCEVCRVDLQGNLQQRLDPPPFDQRPDGKFMPTWAEQHPGTGHIWVADGYGGSAVHRYDAAGKYLGRLTGEEGAGRFNCPHGLAFAPDGHAFIADRGNQRLAVYDAHGTFVSAHDGATHSPCGIDFHDGLLLVAELFTGVKLLDEKFNVLADLGAAPHIVHEATRPQGWPNLAGTPHVKPGTFNSPHDACFGKTGDLYIAEWIVGGRITKLEKLD